jgi:hypothetical protein
MEDGGVVEHHLCNPREHNFGRCPRGPRLSAPASPSGSASPHGRLRRRPGAQSSLALSPLWGLYPGVPLRLTPARPLRPLLTARPPRSSGGAGPAVLFPAFLRWACGGSSGLVGVWGLTCCPCRLWLFSGDVPRGCSTLISLPLPSPWLVPRTVSILECSCMCLVRVCLPAT